MLNIKRTILDVIGPSLLQTAEITDVIAVSEHFRFIEIEAKKLGTKEFQIGEKIQINTGNWNLRTYTSMSINKELNRLGILAFLSGKGPGSTWASQVKAGDGCQLMGPQVSLRIPESKEPLIIFGDETAIGLATNIERHFKYSRSVKHIFEASSVKEVTSLTQELSLNDVSVFPKGISDDVLSTLWTATSVPCQVLLVGSAQSIQRIRIHLKSDDFPMSKVISKVYWSEGKAGLD